MPLITLIIVLPCVLTIVCSIWSYKIFKKYNIQLKRTWNRNIFSKEEWIQIERQAALKSGEKEVESFRALSMVCNISWITFLVWFILTIFI